MSARRRRLTVKPEAQADIDDIRLCTRERWGAEQRRRYGFHIKQAVRSLLDYPERGMSRDDLSPGCRSLVVERHVVFYRIAGEQIIVGRVLHGSQDPAGKVTP